MRGISLTNEKAQAPGSHFLGNIELVTENTELNLCN